MITDSDRQEAETTEWISATEFPEHDGVYQTKIINHICKERLEVLRWCKFENGHWYENLNNYNQAMSSNIYGVDMENSEFEPMYRTKKIKQEIVMKQLDFTKPIETCDGYLVTILSTNAPGKHSVVWHVTTSDIIHQSDFYGNSSKDSSYLRNVPEQIELEGWINIFKENDSIFSYLYKSKNDADKDAGKLRTACVKVIYSYVEGEGL